MNPFTTIKNTGSIKLGNNKVFYLQRWGGWSRRDTGKNDF